MNHWKIKTLLALFAITVVITSGCSSTSRPSQVSKTETSGSAGDSGVKRGTSIGNRAPDFQLVRVDGSPISLADLNGQPSVLVFWTAWCPACKEEAPHINELASQYEPRGVRVLGINIQDSVARTEGGIKEFGIRYAVARDADASITRRYNVIGTPTIIFLDRNGVVRYTGHELPQDLGPRLDSLLAEKG